MDEEFVNAVKALPENDRVKVIAISHHLDKWAIADRQLSDKIRALQVEHLRTLLPLQKEVNAIVQGLRAPKQDEIKDLAAHDIENVQGVGKIEHFWGKVLQNHNLTGKLMTEEDFEILKHLVSLDVELGENGRDYKLLFQFENNPYFDACVLTKEYKFDQTTDDDDLPVECKGSKINWKQGKNITKKIQKKKQLNKKTGKERVIEKEIKAPTFFHFFDNVEDLTEEDGKSERFEFDNELGKTFLHHIIPESLGYFLGVKKDDEDLSLGEDDDLEEDDEDDDQ